MVFFVCFFVVVVLFFFLLVKNHLYTRIRIKQSTQNIEFVLLTENNKKKLLNTLMFVLTVLLLAQTATKKNCYLILTA